MRPVGAPDAAIRIVRDQRRDRFGTYFQGYGTDIYKYDQTTGMVTITHNQYNDVNAVAFSPANPSVMYLGLTSDAVN